jgi:hypothetical protein
MKQNKKYIIIVIVCIIVIVMITPPKKIYIIEKFDLFGGGGGGGIAMPDIGGIAKNIFNDMIRPINQIIAAIPNQIANDAGVTNIISLLKHLTQMMNPTENILKNLYNINLNIQNIVKQIDVDVGHVKSVTPAIKKCIQRIDYCYQRLTNISICIVLLTFMIKKFRIGFIFKSIKLLFINIIETINYIKMAIRTSFIDLHNTNPPLWKVISMPKYKKNIIKIISYSKSVARYTNKIIDLSSKSLGDIEGLLQKPLIRPHDHDNNRQKIAVFKNMLKISKILIIDVPSININIDNSLLYNILKNIVTSITISPKDNFVKNKKYINNHIKNHPYPI